MRNLLFINWLEQHLFRCPSKALFRIDCPGCGFQRSVIALLKGDLPASWQVYPPGIVICATLLLLVLHLFFGLKHGATLLKIFYIGAALTVVANYIFKITTNKLL